MCDGRKSTLLYEAWTRIDDPALLFGAASGIHGTQRLVRCDGCGLVYETPRFPDHVIAQAYADSREEQHDTQHAMRVKSFANALRRLRPLLPSAPADLLDIGTAGGAFLEAAQSAGYRVQGLEPSHDLVTRGRARGLAIHQGTLETHALEGERFDLITFWDVLEHVGDPKGILRRAVSLLRPGGRILVNYPDIGTWQARLAGRHFWWILSVHIQHFSRRTLTELAARTGLAPVAFKPHWQTLELGYLAKMAVHYRMPLSGAIEPRIPAALKRVPLPYYASQTTAVFRANQ